MGLVKTGRRLAEDGSPHRAAVAGRPPYRAMQKQQRAKAGMKPPAPKQARKCAPFPQHPSKPPHTKFLRPNL